MVSVSNQVALKVLRCCGTPTQRGHQQGEELRSLIQEGVSRWMEQIAQVNGIDPDDYIAEFLSKTTYRTSIERWSPELLVEVQAMAISSGQPVDRLLAYSMVDEEWRYSRTRRTAEAPGCTAVGVRSEGDRPTLIGQTMDLPSVHDGTQVVVIHEEQGAPTQAVFTAAGMVCLMGVNSAGVGVVVNNLDVLPASRSGMPVTFIERKILDTFSVEEAVYALRAMEHTIGQHYLIGDPTNLESYEVDAVRVIGGQEDQRVVAHSNHPLYDAPDKPEFETVFTASNTRTRLSCMAELTAAATTLDDIASALADTSAPISRTPARGVMTLGAMAAELSSPPKVRFAPGPPHERPFVEVHFGSGATSS